jgi:hypothetical protein
MLQLSYSQSKITDITWVGKNKEYLQISKQSAELRKGEHYQKFKINKYVKESHIILSCQHISGYLEQKYNIISFTENTLILEPEGKDVFRLCQPDENNRYVFDNSLNRFTFEKMLFETTLGFYYKISIYIDSKKNSRVEIQDDYANETAIVRSPISKTDYNKLIAILAARDIGSFPNEYFWTDDENDIKCCNSSFEIWYNGSIKKCKGCTHVPFDYDRLKFFLWDYFVLKASTIGVAPTMRF